MLIKSSSFMVLCIVLVFVFSRRVLGGRGLGDNNNNNNNEEEAEEEKRKRALSPKRIPVAEVKRRVARLRTIVFEKRKRSMESMNGGSSSGEDDRRRRIRVEIEEEYLQGENGVKESLRKEGVLSCVRYEEPTGGGGGGGSYREGDGEEDLNEQEIERIIRKSGISNAIDILIKNNWFIAEECTRTQLQ